MPNKTVNNKIMALFQYFDTHPKYIMTPTEMYALLHLISEQLRKGIREVEKAQDREKTRAKRAQK